MDPLSDVLALLELRSCAAGGFLLPARFAIRFPAHEGVKCYAVASGRCWLAIDGVAEPLLVVAGDCVVLPRGRGFRIASDLALPPVDAEEMRRRNRASGERPAPDGSRPFVVGGWFHLAGHHAAHLLEALPAIVHIREEAPKATLRWSLERLRDEIEHPQPGGTLIAQQLALTMLVQALRLHLTGAYGTGWLFALTDRQLSAALATIHADPAHPWTVRELAARAGMSRSVFALRFKETIGETPMEYVTRWRMLRASERLKTSSDSISEIASALGYESESAFRKAFRGVMGCSPREFGRSAR